MKVETLLRDNVLWFTGSLVLANLSVADNLHQAQSSVVLGPAWTQEADVSYHSRLPSKPHHLAFISFMYLIGFAVLFVAMLYISSAGR